METKVKKKSAAEIWTLVNFLGLLSQGLSPFTGEVTPSLTSSFSKNSARGSIFTPFYRGGDRGSEK